MSKKYSCEDCYYHESCGDNTLCSSFYTDDNDIYDLFLSDLVEAGRKEYRTAFFDYIDEFNNTL